MITTEAFVLIARALRNAKSSFQSESELALFDLIVSSFINECSQANERFNRKLFTAAIYGKYSVDTL